jgi:acyl-coenzyme A synthetase/AMP-(fatty) acid ligase
MGGYTGDLPPDRFNLTRYVLFDNGAPPEKAALIVVDGATADTLETWTYGALRSAVLRGVHAIRAEGGVSEPGSRILIRLDNSSLYAIAFCAAAGAGFVPIPVSPQLTPRELAFLIEDSQPSAIILDPALPHSEGLNLKVIEKRAFASMIADRDEAALADTHANAPAFMMYTSGTTAQPKGVVHAHRSVWGRRPMYQGWYGLGAHDRVLHAGSLNWTYTLGTGLMDPWANGATAVICTGEKRPELWPDVIRQHQVNIFAAVPGILRQILKLGDAALAMPTLRHALSAGDALPGAVAAGWLGRTGTPVYEALGQTEVSTYISSGPSTPPKPGTAGKPQAGRSVAILPDDGVGTAPVHPSKPGLIAVHRTDPGLMLGYWNREAEERAMYRGDWFLGGDAGVMDEEGYITHLGRTTDVMNAGGYRVSPFEVEGELAQHPNVQEVAVTECVIREGVSIIAAFVVLRSGCAADAHALKHFASTRLAAYKCPKEIVFAESLPKTSNGKMQRALLRESLKAHG